MGFRAGWLTVCLIVLREEEKEVWSAPTLLCVSFGPLLCFALRLLPSNSPSPVVVVAAADVDTIDKCAWPADP